MTVCVRNCCSHQLSWNRASLPSCAWPRNQQRRCPRRSRRLAWRRCSGPERMTPQLIRIVFGGAGLGGFAAGPFTDHYVKLQLPPPGRRLRAALRRRVGQGRAPARALAARADLHGPRLGSRAERADHRLRQPRQRRRGRALGGRRLTRRPRPADRSRRRLLARPRRRLAPDGRRCVRAAGDLRLARARADGVPVVGDRRGRRARGGDSRSSRRATSTSAGSTATPAPSSIPIRWSRPFARSSSRPGGFTASSTARPEPSAPSAATCSPTAASRSSDLSVSGYWKRRRTEEGWRADKPEWNRLVAADVG